MKGHFYPRAKRVGADLVRVEAEALKAEPVCVKSQKLENLGSGNAVFGGGRVGVVSSYWGVGAGTIFSEV